MEKDMPRETASETKTTAADADSRRKKARVSCMSSRSFFNCRPPFAAAFLLLRTFILRESIQLGQGKEYSRAGGITKRKPYYIGYIGALEHCTRYNAEKSIKNKKRGGDNQTYAHISPQRKGNIKGGVYGKAQKCGAAEKGEKGRKIIIGIRHAFDGIGKGNYPHGIQKRQHIIRNRAEAGGIKGQGNKITAKQQQTAGKKQQTRQSA